MYVWSICVFCLIWIDSKIKIMCMLDVRWCDKSKKMYVYFLIENTFINNFIIIDSLDIFFVHIIDQFK